MTFLSRHQIQYERPATRWDEGLPCGNGLLGLLVWGDGHPLNLSLDRSDFWDNRNDPRTQRRDFRWKKLTQLVDRNDMKSVRDLFEGGAGATPYPTKLPCGRITLDFGKKNSPLFESRLDLASGMTRTRIGKTVVTAYVHAEEPLMVVRVRNARPGIDFLSPFDRSRRKTAQAEAHLGAGDVTRLDYPALDRHPDRMGVAYMLQRCAEGVTYTVAWVGFATKGEWVLYLTVQQAERNQDPVPLARQILAAAQATGPARLEETHLAWWRRYWRGGHVRLPDARLEKLWYAEMYKLAAAARAGAPPISLQGVWTADEMSLPPWRGDYHHDLNTELSYWPVHTAGRIEQSRAFADALLKWLPVFRKFARDFYDAPGANVPTCHGLSGAIIRGWAAYVYSRTNGAWLIQHLWWHYRYTMDREFLKGTAYPFIRDVVRFVVSQLSRDAHGVYHIDYSSSPEFHGNLRDSFSRDSTYDLSLIRYALETASAAAKILGLDAEEAREWRRIQDHLQPYARSSAPYLAAADRGLGIWEGQRLSESHRHLAHLMPIFPLGDIHVEGSPADRKLIQNCLWELELEGTGQWCGYSFAWLACLAARIREPKRAIWALNQYLDAFASSNTFHLNGDYKKLGASCFHYRPFTLEGNFAAAHAINEMLLQSWGNRIRLFPAVPDEWDEVAFTDLHAEGALVVSAWRKNGAFQKAEILSVKGGPIRLEHPHPHRPVLVKETRGRFHRIFKPRKDIEFRAQASTRYTLECVKAKEKKP